MSGRVLLMTLSERTSARGNAYMAGWLGKASIVAFKSDEPDKYGNPQWLVYAQEPQERDQAPRQQADRVPPPTRGQRTHDRARAAGRAQQPPQGGFVEAWSQPRESTPFYDDSEAAVDDLQGRDR